jgi:hypothetical protein
MQTAWRGSVKVANASPDTHLALRSSVAIVRAGSVVTRLLRVEIASSVRTTLGWLAAQHVAGVGLEASSAGRRLSAVSAARAVALAFGPRRLVLLRAVST